MVGVMWQVTAEERGKHDAQFSSLTTGTHITGEQARGFFLQSNLPQMVLGQIWGMADLTADGQMDRKEFSIAMTLIKRKLQGYQIPATLPHSMLVEPLTGTSTLPAGSSLSSLGMMSTAGSGTLPPGMSGMSGFGMAPVATATLPNILPSQGVVTHAPASPARSIDGNEWVIPQANRLKYNQMFNKEDRKRLGYLTGLDARQMLISTGLPQNLLAQIWTLADVDADGRLTSEEFSLAMFLSDMVKIGQPLPTTLPPNYIPPSMRTRSRSNSGIQPAGQPGLGAMPKAADSFGDLIPGGFGAAPGPAAELQIEEAIPALSPITLEDKRRENFAKGNAELERRRAELRDQQRKEEEARLAKERAEQEKRDAIRREQERKRLAEQERQAERQRQLEAERDEQRRKALEAREAARKEMERQRQAEWERQRKHALLSEKKRHEESVQLLESQVNNLKYEIETMDNKKRELISRIAEGKENVIKNTGGIDDMRVTRDTLLSSITTNEAIKLEQENLFTRFCAEFTQVRHALQNRQAQNPISDNFRHQQNLHSTKKEQVEGLRSRLGEVENKKASASGEAAGVQSSLMELQKSKSDLKSSQAQARQRVESKKAEWENLMRRNADDKLKLENEQRIKEEAEKQKQIEEEKKSKEEDKWSAFKDLDFGTPTPAASSVPAPSQSSSVGWGADWGTTNTAPAAAAAPAKQDDFWGNSTPVAAPAQQTSNNLWGDSGQAETDLFADTKPTSSPASSDMWGSSDAWGSTPSSTTASTTAQNTNLFGDSNAFSAKPTAQVASAGTDSPFQLPPPQKTPKKETTFGFPAEKAPVSAEVQRSDAPAAADMPGVSQNRKVEIYEAQYDFAARNTDELDLVAETKIKVYPDEQGSAEPGWMCGWNGDKKGIFPENYVTKQREVYEPMVPKLPKVAKPEVKTSVMEPDMSGGMIRSDSAFDEVRSSPNPENGSPAPAGLTCVASYPWRAKKNNHLTFNQGDEIAVLMQQDLWWQGRLSDGTEGWFPKSYVKALDNNYENSAVTATDPKPVISAAPASVPSAEPNPSRFYDQVPETQLSSNDTSRFYDQVPSGAPSSEAATPKVQINPPQQAERYAAMHDYESDVEGDLSFAAGELILVTSKDGEWWTGSIGDRKGIFPSGYVSEDVQVTPVKLRQAQANPPTLPNHPTSGSVTPQSNPTSPISNAALAYNIASDLQTTRHPRAAPRKPANASSVQAPSPAPTPAAAAAGSQLKEIGKVIAAYEATGKEQLSLKPNQLIHIKKKSPSGWWEGELMAKGQKKQVGWFPKDFVKVLPTAGGTKGATLSRSNTPIDTASLGGVSVSSDVESPRSKAATPIPVPVVQAKVEASYPYTAQNDDELTFEQGSIITILNKNDPDWWTGELGGVTGVFPANYVQPYSEPLTAEERKRQQAIDELIHTEETYVDDMVVALEAFYKPLEESKAIPPAELRAIFVNWKELIHCNRKLVNAFKVRRNTCGDGQPINVIGDVLVENFPNMTPYIRFCSRQLIAAQMLQKRVETDENAKQFISKCQQDPRVHGMPLSSYILKPMQRITKYPLLVNRIKSNTDEQHADYQYISEAAHKAQELANQVNEGVRETDNSDKLEWVQNHLSCEGLAEHITLNSLTNALGQRKFIYSGMLTKLRSGRELYAFLFNDFLLFTTAMTHNSIEKVFQLDAKGTLFKMYKEPIFLNEATAREPVNLEKPDTENVCFQISHIENVIDIKCTTTTERNAWLKRLNEVMMAALSMEKVKRERAMSLSHSPGQKGIGRLLVIIMEGVDLLASDANVKSPPVGRLVLVLQEAIDIVGVKPSAGKSDPYCEVSMGSLLHKTKVIPNTLNPKWNSSMQFPIKSVEDDVLCFTVFDQDRFSPNDFLGRTELRVKDILKETREKRGPILKYAKLQEVKTGDIKVKLDLQLYQSANQRGIPVPSQRTLM